MLQLARLDQGRPMQFEPVDLAALTRDAVADARATDPHRPIDAAAAEPVTVTGDEDRLRQVLANLVANALMHTPPGTPIRVRTAIDGEMARLEVSDDGPGMPEAIADHAFERFFRGESSRSRSLGGTGLGLSIVHAIVTAHGGQIALRSRPGEGTTVQVSLPLTTEPLAASGAARLAGAADPSAVGPLPSTFR
jgi:two-component system OmpR family sensor kinase